jgi:hypothetical protein
MTQISLTYAICNPVSIPRAPSPISKTGVDRGRPQLGDRSAKRMCLLVAVAAQAEIMPFSSDLDLLIALKLRGAFQYWDVETLYRRLVEAQAWAETPFGRAYIARAREARTAAQEAALRPRSL